MFFFSLEMKQLIFSIFQRICALPASALPNIVQIFVVFFNFILDLNSNWALKHNFSKRYWRMEWDINDESKNPQISINSWSLFSFWKILFVSDHPLFLTIVLFFKRWMIKIFNWFFCIHFNSIPSFFCSCWEKNNLVWIENFKGIFFFLLVFFKFMIWRRRKWFLTWFSNPYFWICFCFHSIPIIFFFKKSFLFFFFFLHLPFKKIRNWKWS